MRSWYLCRSSHPSRYRPRSLSCTCARSERESAAYQAYIFIPLYVVSIIDGCLACWYWCICVVSQSHVIFFFSRKLHMHKAFLVPDLCYMAELTQTRYICRDIFWFENANRTRCTSTSTCHFQKHCDKLLKHIP